MNGALQHLCNAIVLTGLATAIASVKLDQELRARSLEQHLIELVLVLVDKCCSSKSLGRLPAPPPQPITTRRAEKSGACTREHPVCLHVAAAS